jgi:hypothetical protein
MGVGPVTRVYQLLCIVATRRLLIAMTPYPAMHSALWNKPFSGVFKTLNGHSTGVDQRQHDSSDYSVPDCDCCHADVAPATQVVT